MMRSSIGIMVAVLGCGLIGCAADAGDDALGELPDESELRDEVDGKADGVGQYTYYSIRPDQRRCASPMCGGYWVKRVNRSLTRCVDRSWQSECYVAALDSDALGLAEVQVDEVRSAAGGGRALLRGRIAKREDLLGFGAFEASEAWVGHGTVAAEGVYTRVVDDGIVCITTPCVSMTERALNSSNSARLAGLDLEPAGAELSSLTKAGEALRTADGLMVTGWRTVVSGPAGKAKGREVSQFFTRVVPAVSDCVVSGCSGQVCGEFPMYTTCEWRPEYACYHSATCERQPDGVCAWTPTEALDACLDGAP